MTYHDFSFAPLAGPIGIKEITVPWNTLIISVLLYVVVLVAGLLTRAYFLKTMKCPD